MKDLAFEIEATRVSAIARWECIQIETSQNHKKYMKQTLECLSEFFCWRNFKRKRETAV